MNVEVIRDGVSTWYKTIGRGPCKIHRTGGLPATTKVHPNGVTEREWVENGLYHRVTGPARENINGVLGACEWLIEGFVLPREPEVIYHVNEEWNEDGLNTVEDATAADGHCLSTG